jgi:hypothetical protein
LGNRTLISSGYGKLKSSVIAANANGNARIEEMSSPFRFSLLKISNQPSERRYPRRTTPNSVMIAIARIGLIFPRYG